MTLFKDPRDPGVLRRVIAEYRRLRADQAPNHPRYTMRMTRRGAASVAWQRRNWL